MSSENKTYLIRRSEIDDSSGFNDLLNYQGGQALFRATFGQFSFINLIEYSCLSLCCYTSEDECIGFVSLSDSGDFDSSIKSLKGVVPCTVF